MSTRKPKVVFCDCDSLSGLHLLEEGVCSNDIKHHTTDRYGWLQNQLGNTIRHRKGKPLNIRILLDETGVSYTTPVCECVAHNNAPDKDNCCFECGGSR